MAEALLRSGSGADCTIYNSGLAYKVHSSVLGCQSVKWRQKFNRCLENNTHASLYATGYHPFVLEKILGYLYTGHYNELWTSTFTPCDSVTSSKESAIIGNLLFDDETITSCSHPELIVHYEVRRFARDNDFPGLAAQSSKQFYIALNTIKVSSLKEMIFRPMRIMFMNCSTSDKEMRAPILAFVFNNQYKVGVHWLLEGRTFTEDVTWKALEIQKSEYDSMLHQKDDLIDKLRRNLSSVQRPASAAEGLRERVDLIGNDSDGSD